MLVNQCRLLSRDLEIRPELDCLLRAQHLICRQQSRRLAGLFGNSRFIHLFTDGIGGSLWLLADLRGAQLTYVHSLHGLLERVTLARHKAAWTANTGSIRCATWRDHHIIQRIRAQVGVDWMAGFLGVLRHAWVEGVRED